MFKLVIENLGTGSIQGAIAIKCIHHRLTEDQVMCVLDSVEATYYSTSNEVINKAVCDSAKEYCAKLQLPLNLTII